MTETFQLSTVAMRVHNMDAMTAFYGEAFQVQFREVNTSGFVSKFGDLNGIMLKFVPIRDEADFENYPIHQLGLIVPDVERTIEIALKHGGQREGSLTGKDGSVQGAVRDPDGIRSSYIPKRLRRIHDSH
jgi:catechol 2,3-dioxygenase-like lactoylglutathione lyase family enzyme